MENRGNHCVMGQKVAKNTYLKQSNKPELKALLTTVLAFCSPLLLNLDFLKSFTQWSCALLSWQNPVTDM